MAGFDCSAFIPILTLAVDEGPARSMFGGVRRRRLLARVEGAVPPVGLRRGAPVAAVRGGRRLLRRRVLLLLSSILAHGDGVEPDLVSIFVALEFLSIPAYMLKARRKRDNKSNEAEPSTSSSGCSPRP